MKQNEKIKEQKRLERDDDDERMCRVELAQSIVYCMRVDHGKT